MFPEDIYSADPGSDVLENSERILLLERAEMLLSEADEIICTAVKGTAHEPLGMRTSGSISELIGSDENGGSIRNLRKNIMNGEREQPGWTRPLVSVKNSDRRDI